MVARGEVRWLALDKTRPVVLLNRAAVIDRLSAVLVAPCTTRIRGLPTEVALDESDGMPEPCVVSLDNVTLVERSLLGSVIATLTAERMAEVCTALAVAVGCDE
ncbi:MAG: type II toxin-antitoxin system PemK/MazF family toxin [Actinomycetia bacterium]|nr:type II toxin-antitoxin system PemK/MazF family toxin [Actinomycetes bacterium]